MFELLDGWCIKTVIKNDSNSLCSVQNWDYWTIFFCVYLFTSFFLVIFKQKWKSKKSESFIFCNFFCAYRQFLFFIYTLCFWNIKLYKEKISPFYEHLLCSPFTHFFTHSDYFFSFLLLLSFQSFIHNENGKSVSIVIGTHTHTHTHTHTKAVHRVQHWVIKLFWQFILSCLMFDTLTEDQLTTWKTAFFFLLWIILEYRFV